MTACGKVGFRTSRIAGALLLVAVGAAPLVAQEPDSIPPPPDTVRVLIDSLRARFDSLGLPTLSDTLPLDSTRARILRSLRALARPPGVDSSLVRDTLAGRRGRQERDGPSGRPPADSVMAILLDLPGYVPTRYAGAKARFSTHDERLILEGEEGTPASLEQPGQTVIAEDTITYDDPRGLVWTAGPTTTERPNAEPVTSESIIYSLTEDRGSARNARTRFREGGTWIFQGDLPSIVPDTVHGHKLIFTSCEETVPHYHFAAREAKVLNGSWLVVRNVTLNFADVPVMWLPFLFQNTDSGRSSGILTPRFSINDVVRTSRGQTRRVSNVGFFWAMNDYMDGTVALDWWSDNFTSLTGGFRYNVERQFLTGQVNYRQFWRADGGRELGFDTRHSWRMNERTEFDASARFITDAGFVRQNSFDPREVTGSIDSQGGLNRRFDWGSLSVNGNRKQFLNDDRVQMTLPQLNLSLKPVTLFQAPPSRAGFFNNMTWSGSANASRTTLDRLDQEPTEDFTLGAADQVTTTAGLSSSLNAGALRLSQSLRFSEDRRLEVPLSILDSVFVDGGEISDVSSAQLTWNMSLDYQQRLVGTTTFTPNLRLEGRAKRDDTIEEAQSFVSAPSRFSFGAELKSDIYGLFGGFAGFEAVRHKMSPSISYQYAPSVVPTDLQTRVFGSRELEAQNVITLRFNQTFEAKRQPREPEADTTAAAPPDSTGAEGVAADSTQAEAQAADSTQAEPDRARQTSSEPIAGRTEPPTRLDQGQIVNLLSLQTSAVTYDFTRASEEGNDYLDGFTTTRLRNQISSDFLRGLAVSTEHDLFAEEDGNRSFSPQLTQVNVSFQMSNNSGIVRAIGGLLGADGGGTGEEPPEEADEDFAEGGPEDTSLTDESTIVPGSLGNDIVGSPTATQRTRSRRRSPVGGWSAQVSYSMSRPRGQSSSGSGFDDGGFDDGGFGDFPDPGIDGLEDRPRLGGAAGRLQQLQATVRFRPTLNWEMSWRTAYDLEAGEFNDHTIRLTRELHRWEANFDFLQTATGNWTFRFQVSLTDNRDLKFDYEQQNRSSESPTGFDRR